MGGGSAATNTNVYEKDRVAVSRRGYGELSSDGFQSQEQYDAIEASKAAYRSVDKANFTKIENYYSGDGITDGYETREVFDSVGYDKAQKAAAGKLAASGLAYDENYDRWSLANGVDLDSAKEDWNNYALERQEIDAYEAQEERRKEAPDNLTGTLGQVDYSLAIDDNTNKTTGGTTSTKKDKKVETEVNVNSTNQSLGIYQDG